MSERRVLLVEDDADRAMLTRRALEDSELSPTLEVVEDGAEAIERLVEGEDLPHLVLLDLKLPEVDGFEVLQRLAEDDRARTVPVVVLTSSQEVEDMERCYELGANGYVTKPVDFDEFRERVQLTAQFWLNANLTPNAPSEF